MSDTGQPTNNTRRIKILRAKIEAGLPIKDSEWLGWQKAPGFAWPKRIKASRKPVLPAAAGITYWPPPYHAEDKVLDNAVARYLEAMGLKGAADANPAALYWPSFDALERGERCDVCGRRGETECPNCRDWYAARLDAKRIAAVVVAA